MEIIEKNSEFQLDMDSAVAIGKFDGIHRGHKKLIQDLISKKSLGLDCVIFTFDPEPTSFFSGRRVPELSTKEEKRRIFSHMGIDVLVEFPLTAETAAIPADLFVQQVIHKQMRTRYITAGQDISFGYGGKGDYRMLQEMAPSLGYVVHLIDKVSWNGQEISSTLVRREVAEGRMEAAERLLGMPYRVCGIVQHGQHLGHKIGIPTLNLFPPEHKLLPPNGVYYSIVRLKGQEYRGMTNIGVRPTVSGTGRISVETYLYDFNEDVYGAYIEVELLSYRRPEKRFASLDELKAQMLRDIGDGRTFHKEDAAHVHGYI